MLRFGGIIVPVAITHIIAALFTAATIVGAPATGGAAVENTPTPTTTPPHHQPITALWRDLTPTCTGTGNDGARVQAVYAYEAGTHSQFHRAEPIIRRELARIDSTFDLSARKTGSGRRARWVSTHCRPHIATITVPPGTFTASTGIETTEKALLAQGMGSPQRKYLVFAQARNICGVSTIYRDSSHRDNASNGRYTAHARIDETCWISPDWSVAAHELVHMLGGVQPDAPHASGKYHCDDANDLMCYRETPTTRLRPVCGLEHVGLLDCGGDDYFSTAPRRGGYLASHWNVADSVFLDRTPHVVCCARSTDRCARQTETWTDPGSKNPRRSRRAEVHLARTGNQEQ